MRGISPNLIFDVNNAERGRNRFVPVKDGVVLNAKKYIAQVAMFFIAQELLHCIRVATCRSVNHGFTRHGYWEAVRLLKLSGVASVNGLLRMKVADFTEMFGDVAYRLSVPCDRVFLSVANDLLFDLMPHMVHPACRSYLRGTGCGDVVREVSRQAVESIISHIDIVVERFFQPSVVAQYSERSLVASAKRRIRKTLNQAGVLVIQAKNLGYAIIEVAANGWDARCCNRNEPAGKQEGESKMSDIFM